MLHLNSQATSSRGLLVRGQPKLAAVKQRTSRINCVCKGTSSDVQQSQLLCSAGAAVLSTALLLSPVQPADAQDAAVVVQQQTEQAPAQASPYTSLAKPLPKQPVNKGRVWAVLVGGAVVLFTGTLLLENYEDFFPAIAKANRAMAVSRKKDQQNQQQQSAADAQEAQAEVIQQSMSSTPQATSASGRDVDAVQAGMEEARQRILAQQQQQQQQQQAPQSSSSFPAQLDSGAQAPSSSGSSSSDKDDDSSSSGGGGSTSAPARTAQSAASEHSGSSSGAGAGTGSVGSSSSGSSRPLTNEEINAAARSMRMQTSDPAPSHADVQSSGAAALQPSTPSQGNDSAAAAAAAAAVAVGSSASKSARLGQFVGGVMQEGGQAGFLSAMRAGKGRS